MKHETFGIWLYKKSLVMGSNPGFSTLLTQVENFKIIILNSVSDSSTFLALWVEWNKVAAVNKQHWEALHDSKAKRRRAILQMSLAHFFRSGGDRAIELKSIQSWIMEFSAIRWHFRFKIQHQLFTFPFCFENLVFPKAPTLSKLLNWTFRGWGEKKYTRPNF